MIATGHEAQTHYGKNQLTRVNGDPKSAKQV
jgi:hypothetical protein